MSLTTRLLFIALFTIVSGLALSQEIFPSRPITVVVPYPAGGTSDGQLRLIQEPLSKLLGQPIVIDNKPGASGAIAAQFVAKSKADGYTLLYPNNGLLIAPLLAPNAGYNAISDFKGITTLTAVPMVLVTNKSVPASNLTEFLQYAKSQRNGLFYASAGTASFGHLASVRFAQMSGLNVQHIPYKGEAATTMAVRANEVQMLITTPSAAMMGQVTQGNLTLLGVASPIPSPVVPNAQTINKTVAGFTSEVWFGLLAPSGTPDDVINKINTAVRKVMSEESIRAKLAPTGALPQTSTPAEFNALMNREHTQWKEIISKYEIKAD
jgi:tripartite-type tricarboxylate transporter receptor subunit TctC